VKWENGKVERTEKCRRASFFWSDHGGFSGITLRGRSDFSAPQPLFSWNSKTNRSLEYLRQLGLQGYTSAVENSRCVMIMWYARHFASNKKPRQTLSDVSTARFHQEECNYRVPSCPFFLRENQSLSGSHTHICKASSCPSHRGERQLA